MATTWHPVEFAFEAADAPPDPYGEALLGVTFEHESGQRYEVPGFWDGGDAFRVRFAPPAPGTWSWRAESVDPGLCDSGTFTATTGDDDAALHRRGYLAAGERSLVHADGEPFFWLADTAWTASTRARTDEWATYLDYRVDQGYNVVQVNALRQHDGSLPHDHLPFEDGDVGRPNLQHFRHLDDLVAMAHARGVVPALVALWFDYAGANRDWGVPDDERNEHTPEEARTLGRYLGARYDAYGAAWLVSGDSEFDESCLPVYRAAAEALGEGCQHPLRTAHQPGEQNTPAAVNEADWLDFHVYQSGHTHDRSVPAAQARTIRGLHPARPVLNAEPCYDDMEGHSSTGEFDREAVRAAGWLSVLAGANAGLTYGAHGVWPWHREGDTFEGADRWGDPKPWDEAMEFPSADDYALLADVLTTYGVASLSPRPDLLADPGVGEVAAVTPDAVLVYLSEGHAVTLQDPPAVGECEWLDPGSGETSAADASESDDGLAVAAPGFAGDALLVGER